MKAESGQKEEKAKQTKESWKRGQKMRGGKRREKEKEGKV